MPSGIYNHRNTKSPIYSDERNRKISNFHRGKKLSEKTKQKLRNINLGKKHSLKTRDKIKKIALQKGFGKWMKGRKSKGKVFKKGFTPWNKGKGLYLTKTQKREIMVGRKVPEQCELCGAFGGEFKKGLYFDHDHKTGKFRGWICIRCNFALGMVKDNSELLLKMSEYVKIK